MHLAKAALAKDLKKREVRDSQSRYFLDLPPFSWHPHVNWTFTLLIQHKHVQIHTFSNIALWKNYGLNHGNQCTIELRFEIPSACRPISASLLASSRLLTPQLGATLVLQRMCTFILHTDESDKRRGESLFRHRRARCWPPILRPLTFTVQPLLDYPPQQRSAVVAESGRLVVVDVELVRDVDAEPLVYGLRRDIAWAMPSELNLRAQYANFNLTVAAECVWWQMFAPRLVTEGPCFDLLLYLLLCEDPKGTETCTTI